MANLIENDGEFKVQYDSFKDFLSSKQVECRADFVAAWYDFKDNFLYENNSNQRRLYR